MRLLVEGSVEAVGHDGHGRFVEIQSTSKVRIDISHGDAQQFEEAVLANKPWVEAVWTNGELNLRSWKSQHYRRAEEL
jgi:hypothetical protein